MADIRMKSAGAPPAERLLHVLATLSRSCNEEAMKTETIRKDLRDFITRNYLVGQKETFQDSASFLEHGIIDSTGILELVAFLQDRYEILIDDEELVPDNLDSLDNVTAYVCRKLSGLTRESACIIERASSAEKA
jgi:acyl carrier protein